MEVCSEGVVISPHLDGFINMPCIKFEAVDFPYRK